MSTFDDQVLDSLRAQGDDEADAVVAAHFAHGSSSPGELFAALVRHPDNPTASQPSPAADFYRQRPPWPAWARTDLIDQGQRFFEEWGPQILSSLLLASLPEAYAAAKGVQVLRLTARLATDPRRRLIETTQMAVDSMAVGGLAVGAVGYSTVRRVRLMHAAVRYLIAHDPFVTHTCDERVPRRWCPDWGVPINQEDLLGTLMTFTVVVFDSLERSGVTVARADAEAYLHCWNLVGHLLGIRPDLLPLDLDTAVALRRSIVRRQYAPSAAGREMTAALQTLAAAQIRPRFLAGLPVSTMHYLVGDEIAGLLGLPAANWTRVLLGPARRAMTVMSFEAQHDRLMRAVMSYLSRRIVAGFLDIERGGDRPRFALPRRLADAWSIPEAAAEAAVAGETGKG